jgi:LuxR family maltose regulon positive regulatory protein
VAWASLDAGDDDPWSFFALIVAALRTFDPGLAGGTQNLLDETGEPAAQALVESLVADLSTTTRPFVLVLDDYHVIDSPEIHRGVTFLLSHLPPMLRLVIVTRTAPPLSLARLRASGEVLELGEADLRFTQEEALTLFHHSLDLDLTPSEVAALLARSEGWVTALQLVGISMRGQPRERLQRLAEESSGNVRFVDEYLWEEILQPLPEELRAFLLRTSILDRFNADLCAVVAQAANAAELIHRCDRANLFLIHLDDRGEWYRYHHLFADALRDRLAQVLSEDESRFLHIRAAAWLEEHELIEEAVRHAIAGQDWERTVPLLERVATDLYDQDRGRPLYEWLQGLPEHVLERAPLLAYFLAFSATRLGRQQDAATPLRIAEEAWTLAGDRAGLGLVRLVQSLRSLFAQDAARAIDYASQALDLLPDDRLDERSHALVQLGTGYFWAGDCLNAEAAFASARTTLDTGRRPWLRLLEMAYSSGVLVQRGKLPEAAVLLRRVCTIADQQDKVQGLQSLHRLGDVYVEWNLLDDAERTLRHADALSVQTVTPTWRCWIALGLARIAWARGDAEAAFDEVERAIEHAGKTGWQKAVRDARALQARFWLAVGQPALARRWAESCGLDPDLPPTYERQVEHLTFVRLLIAEGRPESAFMLLDAVGGLAAEQGRDGDGVEIGVLQALAHKEAGDHAAALQALERALALGEPGGYVRAFADEGEAIAPLLRHVAARGVHRDYAQRLLAAIDGSPIAPRPNQAGLAETLSEREFEVVRLVAAGLPNREIGQRLFISEKTVKKHLTNIMGKLGATNRTQAVDQARRLGLL